MSQPKSKFISYLTQSVAGNSRKSSFKSYIEEDDNAPQDENDYLVSGGDDEVQESASKFFDVSQQPNLMPGERVIGEVDRVLKYAPYSAGKQGWSGVLCITNYKLGFLTADRSSYEMTGKRNRNKILGDDDIPLTCIDSIYHVASNGKRKKLTLGSRTSAKTETLEVHCKDFRIHKFGFKFTPKDENKRFVNMLVHHAFTTKDTLLFAYEYGRNNLLSGRQMMLECPQFDCILDWEEELRRCHADKTWRVTDVNIHFDLSQSLPKYFVVPSALMNTDLQKAAPHFKDRRIPVWCYTHINRNSLVRMSAMDISSDQTKFQQRMLDAVKVASNQRNSPKVVVIEEECPSCQEVQESFTRLRKMCMSDTIEEFVDQDASWLTSLESSRWLLLVARCLKAAKDICEHVISGKRTVVIQEATGCDMSCLVSSLAQVLLDPHYRTMTGLQGLVEKEWVRAGHPFQKYLALVTPTESSLEQTPVFLLFLDCIWQLMQQFPTSFEFTETLLTTMWDSALIGIFDTFLFNNDHQRVSFSKNDNKNIRQFKLPSAWKWDFQFSSEDLSFFKNPLYLITHDEELRTSINDLRLLSRPGRVCQNSRNNSLRMVQENNVMGAGSAEMDPVRRDVLVPEESPQVLQLWRQCYLRWQSPAQILSGGTPTEYLQQCVMVEEIAQLQHKVKQLELTSNSDVKFRSKNNLIFGSQTNKSNLSELLNSTVLTSSFPFSPGPASKDQQYTFTPISAYIRHSTLDYDRYMDDD
ncbi:myotubularin-related protein 10-B-like isoform X2 [Mya arenaria]|uniref:myotubularin-related protein 10-B-like isoform X2 n=1 Tax=Mya arenaria TaxID=6604 RepID=UPI0022E80D9C|nr:myotubularin-related protein 10-B-like isoform X2 [Mya arenaria]